MSEKQMTLDELVRWLDDNDVPYGIDGAGKLTVKGDLMENFRDWVRTREYMILPDELICVEGDLWLERTSITSLGNLASVGGDLDLQETPIASLGNLTSVGEFLDLRNTSITSLGNLTSVGGSLDLEGAPITSLGNLTSVGERLSLGGTPITSLGNLAYVEWSLDLGGTPLTSLDDLPQVGGDLHLDQNQFRLLTRETLQKVKGKVHWDQTGGKWITLSPAELEAIITENERRESLHNTRGSDVDWDLYDR